MNGKHHRNLCWAALLAVLTAAPALARGQEPSPAGELQADTTVSVCTTQLGPDLVVDLERHHIDFVDDTGATINLWEGELLIAFDGTTQDADVEIGKAANAWNMAGVLTLYIDGAQVHAQGLQADIDGAIKADVSPPQEHRELVYALELWKAGSDPGSMPKPKLSLKPVETCPPRPPSKEK